MRLGRVDESVRLPSERGSQDRLVEQLTSEIKSAGRMEGSRVLPLQAGQHRMPDERRPPARQSGRGAVASAPAQDAPGCHRRLPAKIPNGRAPEWHRMALWSLSCGGSSVGRARPSQGRCRQFEPGPPLSKCCRACPENVRKHSTGTVPASLARAESQCLRAEMPLRASYSQACALPTELPPRYGRYYAAGTRFDPHGAAGRGEARGT
jgi:hypothetical protein